jgi:hypothetical protein
MPKSLLLPTLVAFLTCPGCIMFNAGAQHSHDVTSRPEVASMTDHPLQIIRPLKVAQPGQVPPHAADVVQLDDDRPASMRFILPAPSTLSAGTPIRITSFYEDRTYALTIWPFFLDLFPNAPTYSVTFVTPTAAWGAPQPFQPGIRFHYTLHDLKSPNTWPWRQPIPSKASYPSSP